MKKVIFSAIAMITFVGSSMANDIAENELTTVNANSKTLQIEEDISVVTLFLSRCDVIYFNTLASAYQQNFTQAQAVEIASSAWNTCNKIVDSTKKIE